MIATSPLISVLKLLSLCSLVLLIGLQGTTRAAVLTDPTAIDRRLNELTDKSLFDVWSEELPVHVLIFGNADYVDVDNIKPLHGIDVDIALLRSTLGRIPNFYFHQGANPSFSTRKEFFESLKDLLAIEGVSGDGTKRKTISPGDAIILYYSGHGFSAGDANFLVPTGLTLHALNNTPRQELFLKAVQLEQAVREIGNAEPSTILIFADACRTDLSERDGVGWRSFSQAGIFALYDSHGVAIKVGGLTAARQGAAANASSGSNEPSPFSKKLFDYIAKDLDVDALEIRDVNEEVRVNDRGLLYDSENFRYWLMPSNLQTGDSQAVRKIESVFSAVFGAGNLANMKSRVMTYLRRFPHSPYSQAARNWLEKEAELPSSESDRSQESSTILISGVLYRAWKKSNDEGQKVGILLNSLGARFDRIQTQVDVASLASFSFEDAGFVFGKNNQALVSRSARLIEESGGPLAFNRSFAEKLPIDVKFARTFNNLTVNDNPALAKPIDIRGLKFRLDRYAKTRIENIAPAGEGQFQITAQVSSNNLSLAPSLIDPGQAFVNDRVFSQWTLPVPVTRIDSKPEIYGFGRQEFQACPVSDFPGLVDEAAFREDIASLSPDLVGRVVIGTFRINEDNYGTPGKRLRRQAIRDEQTLQIAHLESLFRDFGVPPTKINVALGAIPSADTLSIKCSEPGAKPLNVRIFSY